MSEAVQTAITDADKFCIKAEAPRWSDEFLKDGGDTSPDNLANWFAAAMMFGADKLWLREEMQYD